MDLSIPASKALDAINCLLCGRKRQISDGNQNGHENRRRPGSVQEKARDIHGASKHRWGMQRRETGVSAHHPILLPFYEVADSPIITFLGFQVVPEIECDGSTSR